MANVTDSGKGAEMKYDLLETGKRIRDIRKSNGLTQEQFADKVNVTLSHISKLEIGNKGASIELLVDIASKFNVSLDYPIVGKETYHHSPKVNETCTTRP